jgi:hypothetical protein
MREVLDFAQGLRFAGRARKFGLARAIKHAAWRRLHSVAGYATYHCLELPADSPFPTLPDNSGMECREVPLAEMARYAEDPAYDFEPGYLPLARQRGDWCMGVFADSTLVSYTFNSAHPTQFHPRLRYHFREGWIYHFKAFTLPQWRGRRLHALNVAGVLSKYRDLPWYKGLVTLVIDTNFPSLASFDRLGFRRAQRLVVLRRHSDRPWVLTGLNDGDNHVQRVDAPPECQQD